MDRIIDRVRDALRLTAIVGVAAINLGIAACSSSSRTPVDGSPGDARPDAAQPDAARPDAAPPDAAQPDAGLADSARDVNADRDLTPPDAKLWDVLCE